MSSSSNGTAIALLPVLEHAVHVGAPLAVEALERCLVYVWRVFEDDLSESPLVVQVVAPPSNERNADAPAVYEPERKRGALTLCRGRFGLDPGPPRPDANVVEGFEREDGEKRQSGRQDAGNDRFDTAHEAEHVILRRDPTGAMALLRF